MAGKLGVSKAAVQKRIKAASVAIGEEIDLDRDTPEELERKADKRQHAEPKVEPRMRVHVVVKRPITGRPGAAEISSQIEDLWKAFDAIGEANQLRFIHDACLRLGLDPLKMASPAAFGLADEESEPNVELLAQVGPATDDAVAEQAEHGDEPAVAHAEEDDEAALAQADQGDDGAESGAEDLQDTGDNVPEAADPELGVTKCAHCRKPFLSVDLPRKKYGRFYHRENCVNHAKLIATAAK